MLTPAYAAAAPTRLDPHACVNRSRVRPVTSRRGDARSSCVISIDAPVIDDLEMTVAGGFGDPDEPTRPEATAGQGTSGRSCPMNIARAKSTGRSSKGTKSSSPLIPVAGAEAASRGGGARHAGPLSCGRHRRRLAVSHSRMGMGAGRGKASTARCVSSLRAAHGDSRLSLREEERRMADH